MSEILIRIKEAPLDPYVPVSVRQACVGLVVMSTGRGMAQTVSGQYAEAYEVNPLVFLEALKDRNKGAYDWLVERRQANSTKQARFCFDVAVCEEVM